MKMAFDTHKIPTTRTFIPIPYISSNIDKPNSLQLLSNIYLTASKISYDKSKISTIQNHRTSYFHYRAEREKKPPRTIKPLQATLVHPEHPTR